MVAWVGTVAVTLLAAFLRLWDLGKPRAFLFDETYYAKDAWAMMHSGYSQNYVDKANAKILAGHTDGLWNGVPEHGRPSRGRQVDDRPRRAARSG